MAKKVRHDEFSEENDISVKPEAKECLDDGTAAGKQCHLDKQPSPDKRRD